MADLQISVDRKTFKKRRSDLTQSFLKTTRPLIFLLRTLAMIPIVTYESVPGEYEVQLSNIAWAYCLLGTAILYAVPCVLCFTVVDGYGSGFLVLSYIYGRNFFPALVNTVCLRKCAAIFLGIRKTAALGINFPMELAWITFAMPLAGHVLTLWAAWDTYHPTQRMQNAMFIMLSSTMFLIIVSVFSLFCLQVTVAILRKAIAVLNEVLSRVLADPSNCKRATIQTAMREHQKLHEIRLHLNEGFGAAMTLMLAAVFLKIIFCLSLFYKTPEPSRQIYSVVFGFWHGVSPVIAMQISQTVESEFKQTFDLMGKIKAVRSALPKDTKSDLWEWETQLRHQRLDFSANGLFLLNSSQMQTGISTILCYTAILMESI